MNLVKCKCGCTLFEPFVAMRFDETDFMVWGPNSKLKSSVSCPPIVRCVKCGIIKVPSTSMMGKNQNDPEVIAFADLIKVIDEYNNAIDAQSNNLNLIQKHINNVIALQEEVSNLKKEKTEKKSDNVKTTKRGRKDTKSSV